MASAREPSAWAELARLQGRFQELLDRALTGAVEEDGESAGGAWRPRLDLVETDERFLLYAELPGVDREDVELSVDGRWLELSGHRDTVEGEHTFARLERHYGRFRRRVELPTPVDPDKVEARLRDGVLEVALGKLPSGRRVEIGES